MKKGSLVFLFISVLIISGCAKQVDVNKLVDCKNPINDDEIKACNLISANPKLQQCQNRIVEEMFFCIALITKDSEVCRNIKGSKYYLCRAYTEDNPEMCAEIKIEAERDRCYADLGMNLRNRDICNKVESEGKKTACFAVIDLDLEKCFYDEDTKEVCISNILEFSNSKVLCDDLDKERREECLMISGSK